MSFSISNLKISTLLKRFNTKTKSGITITPKDYFSLEKWAFINNFFVHPEYIKEVKTKYKLLVFLTIIETLIIILIIQTMLLLLR